MLLGTENLAALDFTIIEAPRFDENVLFYEMQVIPLINAAYWKQQQHFLLDTPTARERMNVVKIIKTLGDQTKKLYLMIDNLSKTLVGTILFKTCPGESYAGFGLFAIASEYQGKGLGLAMLQHVETAARALDKQTLKIKVLVFAEKLKNYYQTLGYTSTGEAFGFFQGDLLRAEFRQEHRCYLQQMEKKLN